MDARDCGRCGFCEGEWTPAIAGVCMDMYILKDECIININYECKDV